MEQRTLRLGDIVDDYCPRERRLTNHAIVAVVDDTIKQTRCTTCDAEHVYKNGREPRIRKKAGESLYDQVLGDLTGGQLKTKVAEPPQAFATEPAQKSPAQPQSEPPATEPAPAPAAEASNTEQSDADARADAWLAHRRLIRAALPRTEGEPPPARPIPEFTMHQRPQGRHGRPFRFGGGGGGGFNHNGGERNGNVAHPGNQRHGGGRHHQHGGGEPNGNGGRPEGQGQGRPPGGGGRRRGRRRRGGGRGPVGS